MTISNIGRVSPSQSSISMDGAGNDQGQRGVYHRLPTIDASTIPSFDDSNFLPTEFFYVREEVTPKARRNILFTCAIICYAVTIVAFVGIFVTELRQTTTETVVSSSDLSSQSVNGKSNTNGGGWSCQMLSKVSQSGVLDDTEEPILSYSLVKVNENYQQCKKDLQIAQPCDYSQEHGLYMIDSSSGSTSSSSSGSSSNTNYFDNNGEITYITTTSSLLKSTTTDEIVYFINAPDKIFTKYNMSTGKMTALELQMIDNMENIIPGIITDLNGAGHGYIGGYEFHRVSKVKMEYSFVFIDEQTNILLAGFTDGLIATATNSGYSAWGCAWVRLLQDNTGLPYGLTEAGDLIVLPLWETNAEEWWTSSAKSSCYSDWNVVASLHDSVDLISVYWDSTVETTEEALHVFYMNRKDDASVNDTNTIFLYHHYNGKTQIIDYFVEDNFVLGNSMSVTVDTVTDSASSTSIILRILFGWNELGSRGYFTNIYTMEMDTLADLALKSYTVDAMTEVMTGFISFALIPDTTVGGTAHRLIGGFKSATDNLVFTTLNGMLDPIHESEPLRSEYKEYVQSFSDTRVGWLVCNATMIPPPQVSSNSAMDSTYSLVTSTELERKCTSNAISWYASFDETYYFTTHRMFHYASSIVLPLCSEDEYADICEEVGDLPPYACSRQVHETIFTVISAAVANSQLVLAIVCFTIGTLLQFFSSPPKKPETKHPQAVVVAEQERISNSDDIEAAPSKGEIEMRSNQDNKELFMKDVVPKTGNNDRVMDIEDSFVLSEVSARDEISLPNNSLRKSESTNDR